MESVVRDIIHTNTLEISSQVAGIDLLESHPVEVKMPCVISISATGTYQLDLSLHTDEKTLERIASNMKRSPASEDEIQPYTAEFFNILGGRIVSKINRHFKQSARFRPPIFLNDGAKLGEERKDAVTLFYRYLGGILKVEGRLIHDEAFR